MLESLIFGTEGNKDNFTKLFGIIWQLRNDDIQGNIILIYFYISVVRKIYDFRQGYVRIMKNL